VKCNALILSLLHKRGVSKTDTPLLCKGLYFNILHFMLEIGSGARGWWEKAAGRWVTKEVRSGEIGFSGPVRKNNFTAQRGSPPAARCRGQKGVVLPMRGCKRRVPWAKGGDFAHEGG